MIRFRGQLMLVTFALALTAFQAIAQYSVTLPQKQVTVQNLNGFAAFSGHVSTTVPGQPALPLYTVSFLLPPGADLKTIFVSIENPTENELNSVYTVNPIAPIPGHDGKTLWPKGAVIIDNKDMNVYGKDAFFPADYKGSVQIGKLHQYKLVDIQINPYRYNPVTKKLRMITGGTLKVTVSNGTSTITLPRNSSEEDIINSKVVNPAVLGTYGAAQVQKAMLFSATAQAATRASASSVAGKMYLIITTNQLVQTSEALSAYRDMLTQNGATVAIATETDWNYSGTTITQEKPDQIRQYIQDMDNYSYRAGTPLKYVLLIGSPDTTDGDVPMKNWTGERSDEHWSAGMPTDHYYGDISGDWNTIYGKDNFAEVTVGRIPIYDGDNFALDAYLYKIMQYEKGTLDVSLGSSLERRRSVLTISEPVGFSRESFVVSDSIVSLLKPIGFNCTRISNAYSIVGYSPFELIPGVVNANPLPDYTNSNCDIVPKIWNSETPGIVAWYGHGGAMGTMNVIHSFDINWVYHENLSQVSGRYPAMVFANSCETSDPQYHNNCGAMTLYKNAVSYVGASVSIYPEVMEEDYVKRIASNVSAGDALVAMKALVTDPTHSAMLNLYGCPEVCLDLGALGNALVPKTFTAVGAGNALRIDLAWTASTGASSYTIERSFNNSIEKGEGFTTLTTVAGTTLKYSDVALMQSTPYKYRIFATDANGAHSIYSAIAYATSYDGAKSLLPAAPTALSVVSVHSNMVNLAWTGSINVSSYNIKRSLSAGGPFVTVTSPASPEKTTTTSMTDMNVLNGTTYYYTVTSVNEFGESANANVVSAKPVFDLTKPTITSMTSYYNVGDLMVTLNWSTPYTNEVSYHFEKALKLPDGTYGDFSEFTGPIYRLGTSFDFPNLPINTAMVFRIRGLSDNTYSAYSSNYEFTTPSDLMPMPAIPLTVKATAAPEQVKLSWTDGGGNPMASYYEVYYKAAGGSWLSDPVSSVSKTYTNLKAGTKYSFCVRAVFDRANSASLYSKFSPVVVATVSAGLADPTNLVTSVSGRGQIQLFWDDNSATKTGYQIWRSVGTSTTFTQIATTVSGYYSNTGLADNTKYNYKVRTYKGTTYSTNYSNTSSTTTVPNIAVGKTASSGSAQSANPAKNGNDNSTTTRWCASSGTVPQWWKIDLGSIRNIYGTEVMWEKSGTGNVYKYKIETSMDNITWFTETDLTKNTSTAQTQKQNFYDGVRYVRITITGVPSGTWASFYEFRVFGL